MFRYTPILRTRQSEMRGYRFLSEEIKNSPNFIPLFELTKPRKPANSAYGDLQQQIVELSKIHPYDSHFILDITNIEPFKTPQITHLLSSNNGYENWVNFVNKQTEIFPNLIPCLQISDDSESQEESNENFRKEISSLAKFNNITYRLSFEFYRYLSDDMDIIKSILGNDMSKVIVIIDLGYITLQTSAIVPAVVETAEKALSYGVGEVILCSSSFPQNPIDNVVPISRFANEIITGSIKLLEKDFYNNVLKNLNDSYRGKFLYGDYATIFPTPSLQEGGRGWIPRIDLPYQDNIYIGRQKKYREQTGYVTAYLTAANHIHAMEIYQEIIDNSSYCWGIEQIQQATNGIISGQNPSFWISVRLNIHITQIMRLLQNP
ncbi:MAG: hypothetical protein Q4C70_03510 [Planctomycetia bacterium]|nr:hypothetical protein [Planctomycetia bacterium]